MASEPEPAIKQCTSVPDASQRRASRLAWTLSGCATAVWFVSVAASRSFGRVAGHWEAAVTMLFGSFLAGSSPEGGGAVAFPVFTKALHIPAPIARTFGLSIQAVGMTMAVIAILLFRRAFHARAAVIGSVAAIAGFLASVGLFGKSELPFWPSSIETAWVKATFSSVLATTSVLMIRHLRQHGEREPDTAHAAMDWTPRLATVFGAVAFAGGVMSSLVGTGANILVFLFLMVLADVSPKIALPTAIMVMAAVSVVGFVLFGLVDGQLDVTVVGERVVAVGGEATDLAASEADLLGLWLAAVPVVVWGAPLGSLVASRVRESWLVSFVAALAGVEVLTTIVLVDELRTQPALIAYLALGLAILPAAFIAGAARRHSLFGSNTP